MPSGVLTDGMGLLVLFGHQEVVSTTTGCHPGSADWAVGCLGGVCHWDTLLRRDVCRAEFGHGLTFLKDVRFRAVDAPLRGCDSTLTVFGRVVASALRAARFAGAGGLLVAVGLA